MKLFLKYFIPVALILIFTVVISSGIFIHRQNENIIQVSNSRLNSNIAFAQTALEIFILNSNSLVEFLATDDEVEAFMSTYDLEDKASVEYIYNKLQEVMDSSKYLNNVLLMTPGAIIHLDANRAIWDDPHVRTEDPIFNAYNSDPSVMTFILPPKLAPVNQLPIFDVSHRISYNGNFVGIAILPIRVSFVMEELIYDNLEDPDITVLIVDNAGNIYGSRNPEYVFNDTYNLINTEPDLYDHMNQTKNGLVEQKFFNKESSIAYRYFEPLDSYIIAMKDTSERDLRQRELILGSLVTTIILLFISGLSLFLFTRHLLKPVNRLSQYAKEIALGSYDLVIPETELNRNDEIGTLTATFQTMVQEINQNFEAQEQARQVMSEKNLELEASQTQLSIRYEEIKRQQAYIDYLDHFDTLTALPNRKSLIEALDTALSKNKAGAVLFMDLDDFKSLNDIMGHMCGDELLSEIANLLRDMASDHLYVARMGGDEFAILITIQDMLEDTLQKLTNTLNRKYIINNIEAEVTFSMGISLFPQDSDNSADLLSYADMALYSVKNTGKNDARFFNTDMESLVQKDHLVNTAIKEALAGDGFILHYQPQVDITTGKIVAFESLLRMKSQAYGPGEFIGVAENNGHIIKIGRLVTEMAITQLRQWMDQGLDIKPVAINFSAYQLYDTDYVAFLEQTLNTYQVPASMIEIEITESIYIENVAMTTKFLNELKSLGIHISIDDFGTGYSSLNYLTFIPFSKLKIDRSLMLKFLNNENMAVIASIISLAHSLDLTVVAEGIEDKVSIPRLVDAHCDVVQGYYYAKPMPPDLIPDIMDKTFE